MWELNPFENEALNSCLSLPGCIKNTSIFYHKILQECLEELPISFLLFPSSTMEKAFLGHLSVL